MFTKRLLLLCVLGACAPAIDDDQAVTTESVEGSRDVEVIEVPFSRVTDTELRRLFEDQASFEALLGEAPAGIDWARQALFYYSAGSDAGPARVFVEGARLSRSGKTLTFRTRKETLAEGCDAPIRAAVLVVIERPERAPEYVRWEHEDTARNCPEDRSCTNDGECAAHLTCVGKPTDGSGTHGICRDTKLPAGFAELCATPIGCAPGLLCAGLSRGAEGVCVSDWMAATFTDDLPRSAIPDAHPTGVTGDLVVYGQASVPVDVWLHLDLQHPRPSDLMITLEDPSGQVAIVYNGGEEVIPSRFAIVDGISGDGALNGRWRLVVKDRVFGVTGVLGGWGLEVTSRWD
jgi:hypothetical protein